MYSNLCTFAEAAANGMGQTNVAVTQ